MQSIRHALLLCLVVAAGAAHAQERFSPFVPSDQDNVERMLKLAQLKDDDVVVDLGSGDVVRAEGDAEEIIVKQNQYVTLLLPARDEGNAAERRAEITDSSGKVVWQASRLPVTQGYHSLVLPPGSLSPGRYALRLSGRDETWRFRVVG